MTKKQKSGKSDGTTALDLYKKLISNEIIPLLEQFPSVKYLPIERVGGGSFSEVYKAIDIFADEYDNSSYRFSVYVPPKEERESAGLIFI
ncbi:hypothetical protein O9G_000903 [Rozella allomycis CSF55]|uniref:Uncharacterized protein n=1 Tax=Rozella allomycis (strain CSF55) TaxID=988480 RepID=A0A075ARU9_ROZAC|nr:hypothetical protein O9G_000903 [Rozella allomycis CSF55]|eukprot:EPZ31258.1 hypothetical protein O9G_000903 [Rozella allomycis CSF55]